MQESSKGRCSALPSTKVSRRSGMFAFSARSFPTFSMASLISHTVTWGCCEGVIALRSALRMASTTRNATSPVPPVRAPCTGHPFG
eukprot:5947103-Pyramimonas_sp.AAC.1